MDMDLILASSHHLVVFLLVAIFAAEFALLRPGLAGNRIGQLARIDVVRRAFCETRGELLGNAAVDELLLSLDDRPEFEAACFGQDEYRPDIFMAVFVHNSLPL